MKKQTYKDYENLLSNQIDDNSFSYELTINSIKNQILSMKNQILNDLMDTEYVNYFNWNNLMQIIYKYESLNFRITINFNNCLIERYSDDGNDETIIEVGMAGGKDKLETVFNSLVMFAEYFFTDHKHN